MVQVGSVMDALVRHLDEASRVNASVQVKASAVLWPDATGEWQEVFSALRQRVPGLVSLGEYSPSEGRGPAIWIKCVLAGLVPEVVRGERPYVVYMPKVSRSDLRAIENCPRELQPLAELQYRGAIWSQANGKDWTINAFLSSKYGLGLHVAQDRATQEALQQTLAAGLLLEREICDFANRQINAEWLNSLLAPNPTRDVLAWLNDPQAVQAQWSGARWQVFVQRCRTDFKFDPQSDGQLVAAERLAGRSGKWAAVWELFRDSFTSFPRVGDLLAKLTPPQTDLFTASEELAPYPQANEQRENALRYSLLACADLGPDQAREVVLQAESEHGVRRSWLWSRTGQAPLAQALQHLARLAEATKLLPLGSTASELAASHISTGWQVDDAALRALGAVQSQNDLQAVSEAVRTIYLPWLDEGALRLQQCAKLVGGLPSLDDEALDPEQGTCFVFVDGLRYDVAHRLCELLRPAGEVTIGARWSSLPSVTASGKAWCSPVRKEIRGSNDDLDFEPRTKADGKPLSAHHFRKLLSEHGVQWLDQQALGDSTGCAWTESGDLDHYGHEHGLRLARDVDAQLALIVERTQQLQRAGWQRIRIVTDHGWLLVPGGLTKTELPKHQTETRWGRCAVVKGGAQPTALVLGWDWCKDVPVAYAPGASSFIAGMPYAHGGISLQESLVPIIDLESGSSQSRAASVTINSVTWKRLRCVVEADGVSSAFSLDIRTKPALASSSLLGQAKPFAEGRASVAVTDGDQLGVAAVVVVLDAAGDVIQKQPTTVGG